MQEVMEAFLTHDALAVVINLMTKPLSSGGRMTEEEAQLVQLIITFVRNLLRIPDRSKTAGNSVFPLLAEICLWNNRTPNNRMPRF